jgi:hypothetical protein
MKTEQYSYAFEALVRVVMSNREILSVGIAVACVLLLVTSSTLYFAQGSSDPDMFGSIPRCMYLAMLMLTGQGIPEGEFPWYTKALIATTAFFSVAVFAIPSAMLAYGFEVEADRLRKWKLSNKREQARCLKAGVPFVPFLFGVPDFERDEDDEEEPPTETEEEKQRKADTKAVAITYGAVADRIPIHVASPTTSSPMMKRLNETASTPAGCIACPHCQQQIQLSFRQ